MKIMSEHYQQFLKKQIESAKGEKIADGPLAILENSKLKFNPGNVTIFIYFSSSLFGFITDTTFFDSTKSSFKIFSTYSLLILENSSK